MNKTDQNLRDAISTNERIALFCAGGVIFGLVLDVIFAVAFHAPPETFASHWGPVAAGAIVAFGVAGEVWFGRKSRIDSEELTRRFAERLTDAINSAAQANERAAILEKEAAEARERTAQIEKLTMPRRISSNQLEKTSTALRGKTPDRIWISYHQFDIEATIYALELFRIFVKSGGAIPVSQGNVDLNNLNPIFGLYAFSEPEVFASLVIEAFSEANIPVSRGLPREDIFPKRPDSKTILYLYVGHKPIVEM
jgi:hypothetical protein